MLYDNTINVVLCLWEPPKFLTEFYKSVSPSNTWQSLLTIGQRPRRIGAEKTVLAYSHVCFSAVAAVFGE